MAEGREGGREGTRNGGRNIPVLGKRRCEIKAKAQKGTQNFQIPNCYLFLNVDTLYFKLIQNERIINEL